MIAAGWLALVGQVALWGLASLLVLVGIAGTLLPALPGPPLVLAGLLLAAWIDGFDRVGAGTLLVCGGLALLTYASDFAASALGARRAGASGRAVVGAALGTLGGLFFGIPGLILGPFIGAVLGEYSARRDIGQASRAGAGAWLGFLLGNVARLALVFAMLGVFAWRWWV
jgi:uncharacterized protein YqgC (DUF456 family)